MLSPSKKNTSNHGQATISSFFSQSSGSPARSAATKQGKRAKSPIDLTIDSDGGLTPPRKRQRTTSSFFGTDARATSPQPKATQGAAEQWRFEGNSPTRNASVSTQASQRRTHEKAKRILLGNKDVFRSQSKPAEDEFSVDRSDEPVPDVEMVLSDSEDDASKKFGELMEMFQNSKAKKPVKKSKKPPAPAPARVSKKPPEEIGPSGQPYTPFELQVRELKAKHPGTVLMIQSGYKMLFFENDAKIASKELGVVCFPKRNLFTAMIPLHRQNIHLKKLLSQGHKVGIVEQTETAALKQVGDNRNELFAREVTRLYTAATFVDELDTVDELDSTTSPPVMCVLEEPLGGMGVDERVSFAMISISPSSGDVVWDSFEDNHLRTELETRMVHTKPYELLLPAQKLSEASERMIKHFREHSYTDHRIREERFKGTMAYTDAFSRLSKFYTDKSKYNAASESFKNGELMASVSDFPKLVVIALAQSLKYLASFNVADALRETRFFAKFIERTHMLLNANTLTNLEIYRNDTDYDSKGSLMWILDRTMSKFGARLLRSWVGRPLTDIKALQERSDAVEEILANQTPKITVLRELYRRLPDLARGLCRIQYGKCTPKELGLLLTAFKKVSLAFLPEQPGNDASFKSKLLMDVVAALPRLKTPIETLCGALNMEAAYENKKDAMWSDVDKYPELDALKTAIEIAESELMDELKAIRKVIHKPALRYATWNNEEYVVELAKDEQRNIPASWTLVSSTKYLRRYHTPEVRVKLQERAQYKEALVAEAQKAYLAFLQEIVRDYYGVLRDAVNKLAIADCLFSLAQVAVQDGYCKPEFTEDDTLEIVDGRHPMIEALRSDPFVPNSIRLGGEGNRHKIITGPNMGGKSSAVRMTALCAIMAQVGSYVPAQSMRIGLLDGVSTRMGASDELARGRSTFMVEMQETSDILQTATPRSLVILDELGRGTATFDGMAIAGAVLQHLVQNTKCKTLFITHYPQVATDLARRFPAEVGNMHMGFTEETRIDGTREVTFLYRLEDGITTESFGVECARLAGLPESVLCVASVKAESMKELIQQRVRRTKMRKGAQLIRQCLDSVGLQQTFALEELRTLMESLSTAERST